MQLADGERLEVLLLQRPGRARDGRRLQLELDGYLVTSGWPGEVHTVDAREAAFLLVVVEDMAEAHLVGTALRPRRSAAPMLVVTPLSQAQLELAGLALQPSDFRMPGGRAVAAEPAGVALSA